MTTMLNKKIIQFSALLFLFAFLGMTTSTAQRMPGALNTPGVGIEFWLRGDMVNGDGVNYPNNGSLMSAWTDISGSGKGNFVAPGSGTSAWPRFSNTQPMNYNPAVTFDTQASRLIRSASGLNSANSYYLFYVSKPNSNSNTTLATVFDFYENWSYNPTGWVKGKPYFKSNNKVFQYTGTMTKDVSIIGVVRPSLYETATTQQQQLYINGTATSFPAQYLSDDIGTSYNIIGASKNAASNNLPFQGDIMELILLKGNGDTQMLPADAQKINSYLAIKYGITLEGNTSYVNSSGSTTVFDNASPYNVGVFGLAYDTGYSLNQRQATSSEKRVITAYVGSTVTTYNKDNNGNLGADGTYIMFGSNGAEGFTSYPYGGYTFAYGTLPDTAPFHKQNLTYKVQVTAAAGQTIKIRTHMAAAYVIVSSDAGFTPIGTSLYEIVNGEATVTLPAGTSYLSFLNGSTSPGGVSLTLNLWLNASDMTSVELSNENGVKTWTDHLQGNKYWEYNTSVTNGSQNSKQPQYIKHAPHMNFHPAVDFQPEFTGSSSSDYKLSYLSQSGDPVMSVASPPAYTFIAAMYSRFTNPYEETVRAGYIMGFGRNDFLSANDGSPGYADSRKPAIGVARDPTTGRGVGRYYEAIWDDWGLGVYGNGDLFRANATTISMTSVVKDTKVDFGFDGHASAGTAGKLTGGARFPSYIGDAGRMNDKSVLGGGSYSARNFDGLLGEVIAYQRALTSEEQNKVYSYLSLKYATTLNVSNNRFDYTFSDDAKTPIWKGSSNTAVNQEGSFHNNLAAVIRDDISHLDNKQARSTGEGAIVHMGIGEKLGSEPELTGFETDMQAIMWGHNGVSYTDSVELGTDTVCGEVTERMRRIWLVQKTGDENKEVILAAHGSSFPYLNGEVYLLVSSSLDALKANDWTVAIPMVMDEIDLSGVPTKIQTVNYTFPEGRTYFTFGLRGSASNCDGCGTTERLKVNYSTWTNGTKINTYATSDNKLKATFTLTDPGNVLLSSYPRKVTSPRSLRIYRKGGADVVTTTIDFKDENNVNTAATAQFYIYDIDYEKGNYDKVTVTGYCGGNAVYPELDPGKGSRSYMINKNVLQALKRGSGYSAARGRVNVIFNAPVEQIVVEYAGLGGAKVNRWIGIGQLTAECAKQKPPLPPPNTDGISFTKEADPRDNVYTCERIKYTYRIFNEHCEDRTLGFSDSLDVDMKWVPNSLELDDLSVTANAIISNYGGSRELKIDSLSMTQGGEFKFSVYAEFEDNADTRTYYNRADGTYKRYVDGVEQDVVESSQEYWDYTIDSTFVNAIKYDNRLKRIEVDTMFTDLSCYIQDAKIKFTLKFNNPNLSSVSTNLALYFNDEFTYLASSMKLNGTPMIPTKDVNEGSWILSSATLPAGTSTLEFTLTAPAIGDLETDQIWDQSANNGNGDYVDLLDSTGKPIRIPLQVDFELASTASDPHICEEIVFEDASGYIEIPFCGSDQIRHFIITNKRKTMVLREWTAP